MNGKENIRYLALESLLAIEKDGKKSNEVTDAVLTKYAYLPKNERAFYTRLVRGTLENSIRADLIINVYSSVPVRKMKPAIRWILRMGVYQIEKMDSVPDSAAVNESVKLAAMKGFGRLKGFVNGVLRSYIREPGKFRMPSQDDAPAYLMAEYSLPLFLTDKWVSSFGAGKACKICASFSRDEGINVRIRHHKEETLASFDEAGVRYVPAPYVKDAYRIFGADTVSGLSAFSKGEFVVQGVSSMLAVYAAGIKEGFDVLDVCAAPGGKSILAADILNGSGNVESRDKSPAKTALIKEAVKRCGLSNVTVKVHDAAEPDDMLTGKKDVVLVDAPCSGYGVIGRKSDIVLSASGEKEDALAGLQRKILDVSSRYVRPGGVMIYSTCTVNRAENEENVFRFLEEHGNDGFCLDSLVPFLPEELRGEESAEKGYIQLLPGVHECEGFFIARFIRSGLSL